MSTSTRPRARIKCFAASWPPSTSWIASTGRPELLQHVAKHGDDRGVGTRGARRAAQEDGIAALQAEARRVGCDVRSGLVNDPDDAQRHPALADLEPVRQRVAADDFADGIGQPRDVAQTLGHAGDAAFGEAKAVDDRGGRSTLFGPGDVVGISGEYLGRLLLQSIRHRIQRGILCRPGQNGELRGCSARSARDVVDTGREVVGHRSKRIPRHRGAPTGRRTDSAQDRPSTTRSSRCTTSRS